MIRSSTVTSFFFGGVFVVVGGGGVAFSTRGVAETFGSIEVLLTGVATGLGDKIGFGAKDEGNGVASITGVAPIFDSEFVATVEGLCFEFASCDSATFGDCINQMPKTAPPNINKINATIGNVHETFLLVDAAKATSPASSDIVLAVML